MGETFGEIPVGDEQEPERITDAEALDRIARLMGGVEWDSDLPCEVADVVRATGREILDVNEDDDEGVPPDLRARHRCGGCGLQWFTDGLRPLTGGEPGEATGRCQYCNGVTVAFSPGRLVECGLCHQQTAMGTAHAHGGQWIGHECCWDKQLPRPLVCPHGYEDEERLICPSCAAEAMAPLRDD